MKSGRNSSAKRKMGIQGIIRPPPEIRAVADKTASFVAKNGRAFETRIMNSAKGKTPKFAFLHENSPFHAYYEDRIVFYANGGVEEPKKVEEKASEDKAQTSVAENNDSKDSKVDETKEKVMARKAKSIIDPVARALLDQRSRINKAFDDSENSDDKNEEKPEEKETLIPPNQRYTILVPPKDTSSSQLEILKLTAQYVAMSGIGGTFLRELTVREWNSPTWGFLQPRHSHYAYFTQLVEIYRQVLQESILLHEKETHIDKKKSNTKSSSLLELSKVKKMVGIDSVTEEKGDVRDQISLVEETAENISECLKHAAYHAEYDRYFEEKRRQEMDNDEGGIGGASRIDWHDFVIVETIDFPVNEIVESLPPPPPPAPVQSQTKRDDAMDESSDDEDGEKIKVVDNYAPKVVSAQAQFTSESRTHVIDPITGKSIRIEDMPEHMRIQLLDPKWAAEKAKFLEKQKDSNLVGGVDVARNMESFAKARTDIFDLNKSGEVRKQAEASRLAHSQPHMALPRPNPNHSPPDANPPDAKRPKLDTSHLPAYAQGGAVQGSLPPPPPPTSHESSNEQDTITMKTTLSEAEFAKSLRNPIITLRIQVPSEPSYSSWNLKGQTISIQVDVMSKVKTVKQQIQPQLGDMPVNKIQLKSATLGFLKDSLSLAHLNIGPNSNALDLIPKVRGR